MAQAKVIISSVDKMSPGMMAAKKSAMQFQQDINKIGKSLKTAFDVTVIVVAVRKLSQAVSGCTKEFLEAERKYKQLLITLGNSAAYKSVTDNIKKLSRQTLASKGDIESMVSELAGLGKSADEINRISEAAVYLSNVTGQDLNSSMTALLNTYNGNVKALKKLGIETDFLTKYELKQGAAVDLVAKKFGNLSKQMAANDTPQHLKNIKDNLGDLRQTIGEVINYNLASVVADIDVKLNNMMENIKGSIRYVGAVIKQFPQVISVVYQSIIQMVQRAFDFNVIKKFFAQIVRTAASSLLTIVDNLGNVIGSLATAVIAEIQYIAANLYAELVDALFRVFNTTEEAFKDSWLGKLLDTTKSISGAIRMGLGIATSKYDPKSGTLKQTAMSQYLISSGATAMTPEMTAKQTADAMKQGVDAALQRVGDSLVTMLNRVFTEGGEVLSSVGTWFNDNFSDIVSGMVSSIDSIVAPVLEAWEKNRNATPTGAGTGAGGDVITTGAASPGMAILNSFTSAMGEAGGVINNFVSNIQTYGAKMGTIIASLSYVFEGMATTMGESLTNLVNTIIKPLRVFGEMLGSVLAPFLDMITSFLKPIADMLIQVFGAIVAVLRPVVETISTILAPVLQIIGNVLQALMPVIKVFAKIFVTVTGTIQYVIQTLQHWVATLMNWLADLNILGWHPFGGLRMNDPGSPGRYSDFIKSKWASVDAAFESSTIEGTGTATAVTSAGYQGATQVTINIYQQAPVVGDGGMRAFAAMIKTEFDNLNYFGVTA